MMGFEPLVNQRLLPPTFPRYAKIIKRESMVGYFGKLIDRIRNVCEVITTTNLHGILVRAARRVTLAPRPSASCFLLLPLEASHHLFFFYPQDFFCEFSEQSPCVLSRSLLQVSSLPRL